MIGGGPLVQARAGGERGGTVVRGWEFEHSGEEALQECFEGG